MVFAAVCLALGSAGAATPTTREGVRRISSRTAHAVRDALSFAEASRLPEAGASAPTEPREEPRRARVRPRGLTDELRAKGWHACATPDAGFGPYLAWQGGLTMGQILLPRSGGHTDDLGFDVVVHFHGHEAIRKPFVEIAPGTVLVGIDLGMGSGPYEDAFGLEKPWKDLRASIERALVRHAGEGAHVRRLALSSWSAGYGAVQNILRFEPEVDAVVLLDSLHAAFYKGPTHGVPHGVWGKTFEHVSRYAARAAAGSGRFFLTYSEVVTPSYASTSQVADVFARDLGIERAAATDTTPLGLALFAEGRRGDAVLRGYRGRDERAHCGHTELLAEIVANELEPAWDSGAPRAPVRPGSRASADVVDSTTP